MGMIEDSGEIARPRSLASVVAACVSLVLAPLLWAFALGTMVFFATEVGGCG